MPIVNWTIFIRLASAERITVIMPLYFYANSDSKDCYRVSITGKLFANMLKRAGVDSVIILDAPTPQLEGFFDMNVDNLKVNKYDTMAYIGVKVGFLKYT